jgi:hypothetical protein
MGIGKNLSKGAAIQVESRISIEETRHGSKEDGA